MHDMRSYVRAQCKNSIYTYIHVEICTYKVSNDIDVRVCRNKFVQYFQEPASESSDRSTFSAKPTLVFKSDGFIHMYIHTCSTCSPVLDSARRSSAGLAQHYCHHQTVHCPM